MDRQGLKSSESRFAAYVEGLASVIGHKDREGPLRDYCAGLMLGGERKSVEPIAAVTAPGTVHTRISSMSGRISRPLGAAAVGRSASTMPTARSSSTRYPAAR